MIAVAPPFRASFLSPGELSFAHSSLEAGCAACHSRVDADPLDWFSGGLFGGAAHHDSQRCIACHHFGADALHAHAMAPEKLRRLTAEASPAASDQRVPLVLGLAKLGPGLPTNADGELACTACHKEHRGKLFDLEHMGQARCQVCHRVQFRDFRTGHPEFVDYPFHRRTRLYFDHASHLGRHFQEFAHTRPEVAAPESCLDCHVMDVAGHSITLRGFEQTCAHCHESQITNDPLPGLAFLRLPALDLDTLVDKEIPIGEWPAWMLGGATPSMELLFAADPDFARSRETIQELNLADLRTANREQLEAVGAYVWAIKRLVYRLSTGGAADLAANTGDLRPGGLLLERCPAELVRIAAKDWFPDLTAEIKQHEAGELVASKPVEMPPEPSDDATQRSQPAAGPQVGWYLDSFADTAHYTAIRYRPTGHADEFLRQSLEISARYYADPNAPEMKAIFDSLANPLMPGRCTKCHTVDRKEDGHRAVDWHAAVPAASVHRFTEFSHQPHVTLLGESACSDCHQLQNDGEFRTAYVRGADRLVLNPETSHHNFRSFTKNDCSRCHTVAGAGDSCLICHNYHISQITSGRVGE